MVRKNALLMVLAVAIAACVTGVRSYERYARADHLIPVARMGVVQGAGFRPNEYVIVLRTCQYAVYSIREPPWQKPESPPPDADIEMADVAHGAGLWPATSNDGGIGTRPQ